MNKIILYTVYIILVSLIAAIGRVMGDRLGLYIGSRLAYGLIARFYDN